jgi:hypothetical protein
VAAVLCMCMCVALSSSLKNKSQPQSNNAPTIPPKPRPPGGCAALWVVLVLAARDNSNQQLASLVAGCALPRLISPMAVHSPWSRRAIYIYL